MPNDSPTLLEMFAGAGLAGIGAGMAGYRSMAAVEYSDDIAGVYRQWHPEVELHVASCSDVDYRPYAGINAVWASPPCTSASVANSKATENEQDLANAAAVCRCLREARPERFVLENVIGYRHYRSFRNVVATLRELGYDWRMDLVQAADCGVPQSRRRLILRACRVGRLLPIAYTHAEDGGQTTLFDEHALKRWVGWYEAIKDLLPSCPPSELARWQKARLPEVYANLLVSNQHGAHDPEGRPQAVALGHEPAGTVLSSETGSRCRAVLVECIHRTDAEMTTVAEELPSFMVKATSCRRPVNTPRAILIGGANTSDEQAAPGVGDSDAREITRTAAGTSDRWRAVIVDGQQATPSGLAIVRHDSEPMFAVPASCAKGMPSAVLVDQMNASHLVPNSRHEDQPSFTVVRHTTKHPAPRVIIPGYRVVKITPRCLARFMGLGDEWELPEKAALACRVLGNGVCPPVAKLVMESFAD